MNFKTKQYIFLFFYILIISPFYCQSAKDSLVAGKLGISIRDSIEASKIGWMAYPYAFYTPETQFAFGAGSLVHFKTSPIKKLNKSKVLFAGYYTINNQYYFNITSSLFFTGKGNLINESVFSYAKEIYEYHGIGIDRADIDNPDYTHNYFRFKSDFIAQNILSEKMYSGINIDISNNDITDFTENEILDDSLSIVGRDGGFISGMGFTLLWDSRDNIFCPTQNGYYKINLHVYDKLFFSDFNYYQITADFREYFEIAESNIIAMQFYFDGVQGNIPFYRLPMMGGSQRMRGYFEGSYRGKRFITYQIEYRTHVWWKFGLVGFVGLGNLGDDLFKMNYTKFKYSYGFGVRFLFDEKEHINMRMDIGFGYNTNGVYFGLEEAF